MLLCPTKQAAIPNLHYVTLTRHHFNDCVSDQCCSQVPSGNTGRLKAITSISSCTTPEGEGEKCEKSWLCFRFTVKMYFIYTLSPTKIKWPEMFKVPNRKLHMIQLPSELESFVVSLFVHLWRSSSSVTTGNHAGYVPSLQEITPDMFRYYRKSRRICIYKTPIGLLNLILKHEFSSVFRSVWLASSVAKVWQGKYCRSLTIFARRRARQNTIPVFFGDRIYWFESLPIPVA
jgi:hypothetical protein